MDGLGNCFWIDTRLLSVKVKCPDPGVALHDQKPDRGIVSGIKSPPLARTPPPGFTLIGALSGYFYVSLGFNGHFVIPNLAEFRDTAPLSSLGTSIGKTKHTSWRGLLQNGCQWKWSWTLELDELTEKKGTVNSLLMLLIVTNYFITSKETSQLKAVVM